MRPHRASKNLLHACFVQAQAHRHLLSKAASQVAQLMVQAATPDAIRNALQTHLRDKNLHVISLGEVRKEVASKLGLAPDGLDQRQQEFKEIATEVVKELLAQPADKTPLSILLGEVEVESAVRLVMIRSGARNTKYLIPVLAK